MSNKTTCDIYGLHGVSPADSHKDPLEKGHLRAAEGRAFAAEALKNHTLIPEEPKLNDIFKPISVNHRRNG